MYLSPLFIEITSFSAVVKFEINLKLSGLNTFIELGHNNKIEKKIQNLKAFYNRAVRKNDIEKYKEVNLQFENQVVAVKK